MGQQPAKSMDVRRIEGGELLLNQLAGRMIPKGTVTWSGKFPTIDHLLDHVQTMEEVNTLQQQGAWPAGAGRRLGLTNPTPHETPQPQWTPEEDQKAREAFRRYQEERPPETTTIAPTSPTPWKLQPGDDPLLENKSLLETHPLYQNPEPAVPVIKTPPLKKKKMPGTFGGILAGLIGLLVSFFLLIKILEILRRLDWWWISLSSPKGKMQCAFQDTGAQISQHYVGSCPWGCPGFLWTYLRLFIIFLLILLVAAGLLYLTDNMSIILEKLQWESVSVLFSSISSLLPSDQKSLVALMFGLLLIWMTSSSATQTLVTLTQLATLSVLFYKN
ncbi:pre-S protein [Duck hepatitis B virus]|uniref:Large envelope protein n=3 Tax=Duck hepatitis B virus TaxID=12639 RepID=HBSAG_DHBVQ|nr:pre-S protein [Duck hepatitis B virus]Q66405.1 RecName: Full=Large envelope protein; AltName: Full=L glycoprotein; AltName: Full=L-HBsAg; Short=LHB; AltName: Full=Large S protein; AltName: Full=Large surface protein; AltName: Full=Major surface antigen; Contains: RecName: Full=Truncated S protein; Short=St [Duck hepatitis B virus isolate DHBVQCA34]CAA42771.1 pre-S protein [Duck hepatitis B virus]